MLRFFKPFVLTHQSWFVKASVKRQFSKDYPIQITIAIQYNTIHFQLQLPLKLHVFNSCHAVLALFFPRPCNKTLSKSKSSAFSGLHTLNKICSSLKLFLEKLICVFYYFLLFVKKHCKSTFLVKISEYIHSRK